MKFETKLVEIIKRTHDVKSFRFSRPSSFDYKAGQFMFVTIESKNGELKKHFTLSSSPTERGFIEMTKRLTGSSYSITLDSLQIGDKAKIDAPYGKFTFDKQIKEGDIVHLSHGTWETLLNRIGNLPKKARANTASGSIKPIFGMAYVCAGVMGTIPEEEREKITTLMNYENSNAHFLGTFTWGEQGLLPGVGNKHGNLLTGFLVIGEKE